MKATLKVNTQKFRRHVQRVQWDKPALAYLRGAAALLVQQINASPHEDTRRFKRAFAQAARQIGANALMPTLQTSAYAKFIRAKANKDHRKWGNRSREANQRLRAAEDRLRRATTRGRKAGIDKAAAGVRRAKARADKLRARYEISFDKVKTVDRAIAMNKPIGSIGLRGKREIQIINRTYGGKGHFIRQGRNRWGVLLQNLEPHARIVEAKYGVVRKARAGMASSAGLIALQSRYRADTARWWKRAS